MVNTFETQLKSQQTWIGNLKWVSPAIAVQESMNQLAGTSTRDYEGYRQQVVAFAGRWREHFMPFLYNNRDFTQMDHPDLPTFKFKQRDYSYLVVVLVLLALSAGLFSLGFIISRGFLKENILGTG